LTFEINAESSVTYLLHEAVTVSIDEPALFVGRVGHRFKHVALAERSDERERAGDG
jgi:hypothetical protein